MLIAPASSSLAPDAGTDPAELERDWHDLLRFHARFLQIYVVFVNRVGDEAGVAFWGGSQVVDPWGRVVTQAPTRQPALLLADIDLTAVRRRRREMPLVKEARLALLARELERLVRERGDLQLSTVAAAPPAPKRLAVHTTRVPGRPDGRRRVPRQPKQVQQPGALSAPVCAARRPGALPLPPA